MRVRIEDQIIRFKISKAELNQLLEGTKLESSLQIIDQQFLVVVDSTTRDTEMKLSLKSNQGKTFLTFFIPLKKVQELFEMGRSRRGLEERVNNVLVNLQVDLRCDPRRQL